MKLARGRLAEQPLLRVEPVPPIKRVNLRKWDRTHLASLGSDVRTGLLRAVH
jgi:hypothetical protein